MLVKTPNFVSESEISGSRNTVELDRLGGRSADQRRNTSKSEDSVGLSHLVMSCFQWASKSESCTRLAKPLV